MQLGIQNIFDCLKGPIVAKPISQAWIYKQDTDILLALDESGLVGALMIVQEKSGDFEIVQPNHVQATVDNLVIEEQARGKGVGRRLMEEAEIWAKERGAKELRLQVYQRNEVAQKFYDALNF